MEEQSYEAIVPEKVGNRFQHREDAERVQEVLSKRLGKYGLTLHPEKTRLIEFGRTALERWEKRNGRKPDTFDFLGFTHVCARSRKGKFTIHVRTMKKRFHRSMTEVAQWCRKHRHDPVDVQCDQLNLKLRGHYQYYGRPTNYHALRRYYRGVRWAWRKWLNRRTRGKTLPWDEYAKLLKRHPLLRPRITQAWRSAGSLV